jgi:hypothetical protein
MNRFLSLFAAVVLSGPAFAENTLQLVLPGEPTRGWAFNNGQEFGGGAKGGLDVDVSAAKDGKPTLKLSGDFSAAGMYVQAGKQFAETSVSGVSMWVKNPGSDRFTMRLIDGSGQCHQFSLMTDASGDWQKIEFPIEEFFARRGQSDAVSGVAKYESWGGAKDGKWHHPATAIYLLLGKTEKNMHRTLWLNDVVLKAKAPEKIVRTSVALSDDGAAGWNFTNGPEFKGAKGSLEPAGDGFKLSGDFSGGGAYVAAVKHLTAFEFKETTAIRLKYKTANSSSIRVQLVDGTGQTHQKRIKISADDQWNDLVIDPNKVAGGEHWGGRNDGQWHQPAKLVSFALNKQDDPAVMPSIFLKGVTLEGTRASVVAEAFKSDFAKMPRQWNTEGGVTFEENALKFSRTENEANIPANASSTAFKVAPGNWQVELAYKSELTSPDNSYSGTVVLQVSDVSGKPLETFTIADVFGTKPWTSISTVIELPKGAASARFSAKLNKTWGSFRIKNVSAGFVSSGPAQANSISRILFSTAQLGNLLYPDDPREVSITVETTRALSPEQREVTCVVRDYWGVEQLEPTRVRLSQGEKGTYTGTFDLSKAPLSEGRYYEVEATAEQPGAKSFSHQTSFAILPEAPSRKLKPEETFFTARNWDNRIPEYIKLSDRLGIRIVGLWGGWSSKPPYKPELPQIELVKKLGLGWLTTTPAKFIEEGKRDYDETALREGVRNFIHAFGGYRPMIINLGNEPHGTGDRVKANVDAYRVLYEEIKKTDPTIPVVATSVEPNPGYFGLGYGKYCDAFDFHVYESPQSVRNTMKKYRELMKEHGVVKPIWSTELGLNSQGQTRHVVAVEVFKKTAGFFAEGGANMCWFSILYPDKDGKSHGSSGDTHNIFDSRFNRYAPRLDAIAWYHAVNGMGRKKFVEEKSYPGDIKAFLFRDSGGASMQIVWKEKGAADLDVPLAGVGQVELIRVDGTRSLLDAGKESVTLSIGEDPMILLYQGGGALAPGLSTSESRWIHEAVDFGTNGEWVLPVQIQPSDTKGKLTVLPGWKQTGDLILSPPVLTTAREIPVTISLVKNGRVSGELHRRLSAR